MGIGFRAKILRMIGVRSCPGWLSLAAAMTVSVALNGVAQRPDYPILQEIRVDQNCRLLLAPAEITAAAKKARNEKDPVICHLENVLHSQHVEEAIVGNELRRSRVAVDEQTFVMQNISAEPAVFVVEQPVGKGWVVDSDPPPAAMNGSAAVFRAHAQPGEIVRLHVGERHTTPLRTKVIPASVTASSTANSRRRSATPMTRAVPGVAPSA